MKFNEKDKNELIVKLMLNNTFSIDDLNNIYADKPKIIIENGEITGYEE